MWLKSGPVKSITWSDEFLMFRWTLTVAVWTRSKSVPQLFSHSTNTHVQYLTHLTSQSVSQEAIAAIGRVWTVLCHQEGTYLDVFCYHLSHFFFLLPCILLRAVLFHVYSEGSEIQSQLFEKREPTNMLLFFFCLFFFLLKFSIIFYTFSTSKVLPLYKKLEWPILSFFVFLFIPCVLTCENM